MRGALIFSITVLIDVIRQRRNISKQSEILAICIEPDAMSSELGAADHVMKTASLLFCLVA